MTDPMPEVPDAGGDSAAEPSPPSGGVLVVAADASETSGRATDLAFEMAGRLGAEVVAVSVAKLVAATGELLGASTAILTAADDLASEIDADLARRTSASGVPSRLVRRRGSVLSELTAAADEADARMVLVGASTSPGHRLMGALAPKLVRVAHWPVVVVP